MFHFFFYKKQKQHCHINDYLTLVFNFIKKKQGSITAFISKQRKKDQNHFLNNWNPVCNQTLDTSHEAGNPFDLFATKVCKDDGDILGHLTMEIL